MAGQLWCVRARVSFVCVGQGCVYTTTSISSLLQPRERWSSKNLKQKTFNIHFYGWCAPIPVGTHQNGPWPACFFVLLSTGAPNKKSTLSTCCSRSCWKRAFECENQSQCTWGTAVPHQHPAWFVARGFPTQAPLRCRACSVNVRQRSEFQRTQSLLFVGTLEVARSTVCRPLSTVTSAVIERIREAH